MSNWKKLEEKTRDLASIIWKRKATPERISGVNFDAVVRISNEHIILIEVTEEFNLDKIRNDIAKIQAVKTNHLLNGILATAYIVLNKEPTPGMLDLGRDSKINVISIDSFSTTAFDFKGYAALRKEYAFGSALNPATGEPDTHTYIPVDYINQNGSKKFKPKDLSEKLAKGHKIILLGDYGTGKSRCTKETFSEIIKNVEDGGKFALAINLREHWGAATSIEIISGHLQRLGISSEIDRAMQLLASGHMILILDGFDEVGSQTFGPNQERKVSIRRAALQGVRELIQSCPAGVLITGRPHYFNSEKEMYDSLGISTRHQQEIIIKCATEFSEVEAKEYLQSIGITGIIPAWLPRKPLMFLVLSGIEKNKVEDILSSQVGELGFWGQFLDTVCEREAKIHGSIDPEYVRNVLINLAKFTRTSDRELGRLTPKDINQAYEDATGTDPDESGQLMLSRLCTLGRIEPESPDRQFVDPYIVQLLFAENIADDISNRNFEILNENWRQPLKEIGIFFLAQWIDTYEIQSDSISMIKRESTPKNNQAISELISSLSLIEGEAIDFENVVVKDAEVPLLSLSNRELKGVLFSNTIFNKITFESCKIDTSSGLIITNSHINIATGLTSQDGLPSWIKSTTFESPQSASNSSRIKSSNLPASQKLLLSIIQKIFFQKGGGRKESSLYKGGFGQQFDRKIIDSILSTLVNDEFVTRSKDTSGFIYNPKREFTPRMKAIKDQLSLSKDELWLKVLTLDSKK